MKSILLLLLALGLTLLAKDIEQHSTRVGISLGSASLQYARQQKYYTIIGASLDYFALKNLAIGAGYRGWFGASPAISQLQLNGTYYLPLFDKASPYAGLVYQRNIVESRHDFNEYGVRIGLTLFTSNNTQISIGYIELYNDAAYLNASHHGYSELSFGASF